MDAVEYHGIISSAGAGVAHDVHIITQERLKQGVADGLKVFHETYPDCDINPAKLEALLFRTINERLTELCQTTAETWDDRLFRLGMEG